MTYTIGVIGSGHLIKHIQRFSDCPVALFGLGHFSSRELVSQAAPSRVAC